MNNLIIFPFGGNAKEAVSVVEAINRGSKQWNIVGFIDDNTDLKGEVFANYKVLGGREELHNYPDVKILAVPGSPQNYLSRHKVIDLLKVHNNRFVTLIDPSVSIGEEVKIGYNNLIMPGVVITANVSIGNHCVILPNSVISHDSNIEDYCMIGSNVSISGSVNIKKQSYIGTGAKIINDIDIAEKTLVGLGSIVIKPTDKGDIVAGNPARLIRKHNLEN